MQLTKRHLGEGYVTGTGIVLSGVLLAHIVFEGTGNSTWAAVGPVPAAVLAAAAVWLRRFELDSEGVWTAAKGSALAIGLLTVPLVGLVFLSPSITVTPGDAVLLSTALASVSVAGGLAGVAWELRGRNEQLSLQNAVLHRVMRHNLRNDMTVVLCLLSDIERTADPEQREKVEQARRKIESLVDLTDKVRRLEATDREPSTRRVDLAELIECRIDSLRATYPSVEIGTDLPDRAVVQADEEVGLVVDNVVESAVRGSGDVPNLEVAVENGGGSVLLRIEDHSRTIPESDLEAVAAGTETDLEHGIGVELWLAHWIVDANGGDLTFETDEGVRRIDITLSAGGPTVGA